MSWIDAVEMVGQFRDLIVLLCFKLEQQQINAGNCPEDSKNSSADGSKWEYDRKNIELFFCRSGEIMALERLYGGDSHDPAHFDTSPDTKKPAVTPALGGILLLEISDRLRNFPV